jgi:aminopeptidase N
MPTPFAPTRRRALLAALIIAAACGRASPMSDPAPGVARTLAVARAAAVQDLRYAVHFELPAERDSLVRGRVEARFLWNADGEDVVLDFRAPASQVGIVTVDGDTVTPVLVPDHVVIPEVARGARTITVEFTSTNAALNRNADFLYALFVPDRASTAFPVFEQPDLKARFTISLGVPAAWDAVSNGTLVSRDSAGTGERHQLRFAETAPISTYLLSFAAGKLQRVSAERGGRRFTMYHRETDAARVSRNADAIFDLHASAIAWLETYTAIPYPFDKFDFFAVPAFQFGGMEHPGAVWYRADALFLDESPARTQELGRASLIAHETAHMWFGDLVTMEWFNDVWMKEVFANFMAAKIVTPAFPDVDHALRFFQSHHATAYGVDRTPGANPIRQDLANLREAGSLYGAIIYQKAPVVMKQLEALVGDSTFRAGLRQYLAAHRFGNATWSDLVRVLDDLAPEDVTAWSRVWVEEPGRPTVTARWADGRLVLRQRDTWTVLQRATQVTADSGGVERALRWPQRITTLIAWGDSVRTVAADLRGDSASFAIDDAPAGAPDILLPGVDGASYGRFPLSPETRRALITRAGTWSGTLAEPLSRAVAWQGLLEEMLDGELRPQELLDAALLALPGERDELVATQLTGLISRTYWRFLTDSARRAAAPQVERTLWQVLEQARTPGRKGALFNSIIGVTLTDAGVARLERIWRKRETPRGFPISESQYINLAEGLALRGVPDAEAILDEQERRITDPDRLARQRFMRAALSATTARRDSLFATFAQVENRRRESWVLDAMGAMNHPLRAPVFERHLEAALALTAEIQRTGDIFFPLNWMNATLGGHQSPAASAAVRAFIRAHPDMNPRVRGKMLQASDELFRAARAIERWSGAASPTDSPSASPTAP